jgi:metallophosphoesterase (TIGR00282 family)
MLRPANYPETAPGKGYNVYDINNTQIAVINLQGRVFMDPIDCPFAAADKILEELSAQDIKNIVVDIHAEATSEKIALGWYLDGKVSAVTGTHTHVQTSDAAILPQGTAYISDTGMTGSRNGVIGVEKEEIIKQFITGLPFSFRVAKGNTFFSGVIIEIDTETGKSTKVNSVDIKAS